ncbi:hypothetical protein Gorai_001051 [Gossypium raimondii]|uniref:Uncharacterized protein n=1 Tax=Gossypium raimondii TaxID=29730 RepID=A0A7J8PF85_GOSRA|nr:hypothetical protein [Gossypium raimondii]
MPILILIPKLLMILIKQKKWL